MGHSQSKGSKSVCPEPDTSGPDIIPLVGSLTYHDVSIIIAGATGAFAAIVALLLIMRHATHFSNPTEQKQIIRAIFILPPFALISFLCVWLNGSPEPYISPGLDVAEAFPMAAFFLLITTFVVPDEENRQSFFSQLELINKRGKPLGGNSLKWYRRTSIAVLQYVPVSILLWVAAAASLATGTYCDTSNSPRFAHIWITCIRMLSVSLAIISILRFYKRSKPVLKPRGAMKKLICFKILVFLNFVQGFVFNFLKSKSDLHPTKYMTFNDIYNGLPSLILCCEMALISPYFWYAYPVRPYLVGVHSPETGHSRTYQGGPLGIYAIFEAINILDIVKELVRATNAKSSEESSMQPMEPRGERVSALRDSMRYEETERSRHGRRGNGRRKRRARY